MKFQLSIRAALVLLTIACASLAIWANGARRQQSAVKAIRDAGGRVYYGYQFSASPPVPDSTPRAPRIFIDLLGVDYFEPVTIVSFLDNRQANPSRALPQLNKLSGLKELYLWGASLDDSDLIALSNLTALEVLHIQRGTRITDDGFLQLERLISLREVLLTSSRVGDKSAAMLANCPRLEQINLSGCQITDDGMRSLARLRTLQELWIQGARVTDDGVAAIAPLVKLEELDLQGTEVTAESFDCFERFPRLYQLLLPSTISVEDRARLAKRMPHCIVRP